MLVFGRLGHNAVTHLRSEDVITAWAACLAHLRFCGKLGDKMTCHRIVDSNLLCTEAGLALVHGSVERRGCDGIKIEIVRRNRSDMAEAFDAAG